MKIFSLLYMLLLVLYVTVAYLSVGYDDEFTNIAIIEQYGFAAVRYFQATDVHPPGSYLINYILWSSFGRWEYVRVISGLLAALSFIYAISYIRRKNGDRSALLAFAFLGLNPAFLLWCTGIRWYAYFVPVLVWLMVMPNDNRKWYWCKLAIGLVLLGYLGYAALIIAPAVIWLYYSSSTASTYHRLKALWYVFFVVIVLYSYQFWIFLTVHNLNKGNQVSSLISGLRGLVIAEFSNQGVFPLSIGGVLSAIGVAGMTVRTLQWSFKSRHVSSSFASYVIAIIGLIGSGVAGKFRNFVVVSPFQGFWQATIPAELYHRPLMKLCVLLIVTGNFIGVYHVARHENTTKNSWNLPSAKIVKLADSMTSSCGDRPVILSHDPTLSFLFQRKGFVVIGPYARFLGGKMSVPDAAECLMVLRTYPGSIDRETIQAMMGDVSRLSYRELIKEPVGRDEYYKLKQWLDPRYPEYQVEITYMKKVKGLSDMPSWAPSQRSPDEAARNPG